MPREADWRGRRLHFVGIGGSGMSALAEVCVRLGARVSGSDRAGGPVLDRLRGLGIDVEAGHAAAHVPESGELVYSSAVRPENVERVEGRKRGLREVRRGELLAEAAKLRRCIAVAGTHGKTTTAWMTVHALRGSGLSPSYIIGAGLRDGSPASAWGPGEWVVVEADESDRTFLALAPEIAVVTNVALEHEREYASLGELEGAFASFLRSARSRVGPQTGPPDNLRLQGAGSSFRWRGEPVTLPVPGAHNASNAVAALEACALAGAQPAASARALATFPGVRRRIEALGQTPAGASVYDDYAIHANEVAATLAAVGTLGHRRLVAVFEPLLYSRTLRMAADWARALAAADVVVVLDVFPGSEADGPHPPVSGRLVADALAGCRDGPEVAWKASLDEARDYLETTLREGDACVLMGVGGGPEQLGRELASLG